MEVNINSKILKELRISRSWTQEELAEAAGIHPRTLQRVESLGVGSKSTLRALARALEVEVGDIQTKSLVKIRLLEAVLGLLVWVVLAWVFSIQFAGNPAALAGGRELLLLGGIASLFFVPVATWGLRKASRLELPGRMMEAISITAFGVFVFVCIYVSLIIAEVVGNTSWFLYLRNDAGVPITLLRAVLLSITVLPAAYLIGSWIIRRSPRLGRKAMLGAVVAFALAIAMLQVVYYEWNVWSSSLLQVLFPVIGLWLAHRTQMTAVSV